MPETLYPRQKMLLDMQIGEDNQHTSTDIENHARKGTRSGNLIFSPEKGNLISEFPRTKSLPFLNLHPVPGMRHPRPWDSIIRFGLTFRFPTVVIAVIGYSFVWYWWILSVITMLPAAYATYSPLIQGLLCLGLFCGTIVSEICCSGRLSDHIVEKLAKRNGNMRVAEMRLWLAYPAVLLTASESFTLHKCANMDSHDAYSWIYRMGCKYR